MAAVAAALAAQAAALALLALQARMAWPPVQAAVAAARVFLPELEDQGRAVRREVPALQVLPLLAVMVQMLSLSILAAVVAVPRSFRALAQSQPQVPTPWLLMGEEAMAAPGLVAGRAAAAGQVARAAG
ncbi:hypothetical protein ACLBKU_17335 [Erythrobacter sp. NE805]|uniref:hypothetical protein n=1 Tax=Erythrobacter sp. NE805 TaxID=3389875 RepID=UPI00396B21DA